MQKYTEYTLFLLKMESELLRSREVCIALHEGIYEYRYEIIAELVNEGYIDGYLPKAGPNFCCILSDKAMNAPLLIRPKDEHTK